MTDQCVVDTLNELLAVMEKRPHARLAEAGVFLSAAGTEEHVALQRVLEEEEQHIAELAGLLIELGGGPSPAPGTADVNTAGLHYLDLQSVLKEMSRSKEQLSATFEAALERLSGSPSSSQLVSRIAADNRGHLGRLGQLVARSGSAAAENT